MKIPKLRAWDIKEKQLLKIGLIDFEDKTVYDAKNECFNKSYSDRNMQKRNPEWGLFDDLIFMQSIGLKDKNGEEIFEGDILTDEGDFGGDCWDYATIEFDETDYTYYLCWQNEGTCQSITECENYSVAGNIYENPELLED